MHIIKLLKILNPFNFCPNINGNNRFIFCHVKLFKLDMAKKQFSF